MQKQRIITAAGLVLAWASDRNIIKGSDAKTQTLKTVSEFGELCDAIQGQDTAGFIDAAGDVLVTQIIASEQMEVDFEDCVEDSFNHGQVGVTPVACVLNCAGLLGLMADNVIKKQPEKFRQNLTGFISQLRYSCEGFKIDLAACLEEAYEVIKDRRGVMYNGAFIKSDDPRFESACAELGMDPGA